MEDKKLIKLYEHMSDSQKEIAKKMTPEELEEYLGFLSKKFQKGVTQEGTRKRQSIDIERLEIKGKRFKDMGLANHKINHPKSVLGAKAKRQAFLMELEESRRLKYGGDNQ